MAFPAKYSGRCAAECDTSIEVGDMILFVELDSKAVAHADCPDPLPPVDKSKICTKCFLLHAGECF